MKGEWCYFCKFFSKDICEKIIRDGLKIPSQDAVMGVGGDVTNNSFRRSKIRFLHAKDPQFKWLFDALWDTALGANKDFFNFDITKLDYIQLAEYDSSYKGEYKEHHDVFWLNGDPVFHRKLSCVVQLSDPTTYEGGDLVLTETGHPLDSGAKQQGSVVFFPSMFRHKANPVTAGVRYSLAAWFDGPKWR